MRNEYYRGWTNSRCDTTNVYRICSNGNKSIFVDYGGRDWGFSVRAQHNAI